MKSFLLDTHALFWYLTGSPRLGHRAKQAFDDGEAGRAELIIPVIVLAELYFLAEKLNLTVNFEEIYQLLLNSGQFRLLAMQPEDVLGFDEATAIPEMHDRIIAGVAHRLGVPLLTKDLQITQSGLVETLW